MDNPSKWKASQVQEETCINKRTVPIMNGQARSLTMGFDDRKKPVMEMVEVHEHIKSTEEKRSGASRDLC